MIAVQMKDGRQLRLDAATEHLVGMESLYRRISEGSSRHLLLRSFAAIEGGQTVTLGVFRLSKAGLHWGTHFFAWDDSTDWMPGKACRIRDRNRFFHPWIRLAEVPVPNQLVFLQLAEHYLKSKPE